MRKSKYNSFDELPLMLTVEDVSHVLGIGLAHAYEVAHRRDFPTIECAALTLAVPVPFVSPDGQAVVPFPAVFISGAGKLLAL